MNCYQDFASVYDRLMNQDINYEKWADYIENIFHMNGKNPKLIADLACGTGNITLPMAVRGYEMIGVDASETMLSVAREKAEAQNVQALFLCQDMTKLDLYGGCDAFLCMIDGINYIISPQKLLYLFKRIRTCFMEPGAIFIFDISSRYKLENVVGNNTFIHDEEDLFYAWENRYLPRHHLSQMYLNFFSREKGGLYRRFGENHLQRAYSEKEIRYALKAAGFSKINAYRELTFNPAEPDCERIVFTAE